ncbi:phage integrase N-terminal SAM-like domain-containing protein [Tumebacillus sp. ITR2]|uniref:Phage integrase N-terminal SAM-like domain-containing protein n=1 Tax=Tumebacillus amylolyticus TaxID=2801339 RepID=A0ABS1JC02_9BACL|nr:phage integrase N-terminal SAM-like domain-containing protein [Tumebacillus amylolyticus]
MTKFRMMTETHTHRNLDIDETIQLFLTSKRSEKKSEQTLVSYKGGLERFKRWFRENDHSEFSRSCIESYVNYLTYERKKWIDHPNIPARNAAGLSSRTVNNAVRILTALLYHFNSLLVLKVLLSHSEFLN